MLHQFEEFDIHTTWAVVGLLMTSSKEEIKQLISENGINYGVNEYSPYFNIKEKLEEIPFEILNANKEVKLISNSENQELASHTFSHYYALEEGQKLEDFHKDIALFKQFADNNKFDAKSLIFPRNQANDTYLKTLSESGYVAYRGNQKNNLWTSSPYAKESIAKKGKRFIDAYYNISSTESFSINDLEVNDGLVNIPASRFLRPSSGNSLLEKRKIKRIKSEMTKAAKEGQLYHLWWHPHNFSQRTDEHFEQLTAILSHYKELENRYGFTSLNMQEIGATVKK